MRFPSARISLVLLLLAIAAVLPNLLADAANSSFIGTAVSGGAGREHCPVGMVQEEGTHLYCTSVAKRVLFAVTSGFRKTKVHARRLSAQCIFSGISRVAEVSRFEFNAGKALLPLMEGPHREKTPQGARSPPLKDTDLLFYFRDYSRVGKI